MRMIKTINKIFAVAAIALCAIMVSPLSCQAEVFTWSQHNLTFEVPDGGFVTYNSNTRFEIHWDEMVMTVQLFEKQDGDQKRLDNYLQRRADDFMMYNTRIEKMSVKGFDARNINGKMPDGSQGLVAYLVSKKSHIVVEVTVNYLIGNREIVDDMVKSFAENSQAKPNREKHKQKIQKRSDAERQDREQQKQQQKQQPSSGQQSEEKYIDV